MEDGPDFIVASTPQGGKTTLLQTWGLALATYNSPQQIQLILVAMRRDSLQPLRDLPHVLHYCRTPSDFYEAGPLERLIEEIQQREQVVQENFANLKRLPHIVVMIDDYSELVNEVSSHTDAKNNLSVLAKRGREVNIHTIVTGNLPKLDVGFGDPVVDQLKSNRSGFLLQVIDATESNPLGLRLRASEIKEMPAGRGYLARRGSKEMLQVATPGDSEAVIRWVADITDGWKTQDVDEAAWPELNDDQNKTNGGDPKPPPSTIDEKAAEKAG
jgi:S-DNA-T family DNA segregation ATPase FtsK/SpoIIIE